MLKNFLSIILSIVLLSCFFSFVQIRSNEIDYKGKQGETEDHISDINSFDQVAPADLAKICKVWGYVKYTHPVFLSGEKDWDQELLYLLTDLCAKPDKINSILYDWYISLGDLNYQAGRSASRWALASEEQKLILADNSWISNPDYLGDNLSAALMEIKALPNINRAEAPISFDGELPCFTNENNYPLMDYKNNQYRLLGLFRLWNVMEYYYPYVDLSDNNWHDVLLTYIPIMLEGNDKWSYEETLIKMTAELKDSHIRFTDPYLYWHLFGEYQLPIAIVQAEGKIVVQNVFNDTCKLQAGDILISIEGEAVEDRISKLKEYISLSSDEKIIQRLSRYILSSAKSEVEVTVLRQSKQLTFKEQTYKHLKYEDAIDAYKILDHNIGLINVSKLSSDQIDSTMEQLDSTDGLIIDLRQYPKAGDFIYRMSGYILEKPTIAMMGYPSQAVPGVFLKQNADAYYGGQPNMQKYRYKNPVVILVDETSISSSEYAALILGESNNVTIIGENTVGAIGNVVNILLPGGKELMYTALAVYSPSGDPVQGVGITPDIIVKYSIADIIDGRDPFIERAIEYISEN